MPIEQLLTFGPYRLDAQNGQLWRGKRLVRLTGKAMGVLQYLAERPGQLVTKEELFTAVWPRVVVSEEALTKRIHELRRALREDAKQPKYVATVHRRGFRWIAPLHATPLVVSRQQAEDEKQKAKGKKQKGRITLDPQSLAPNTQSLAPPLVGREQEMAELQAKLEDASAGRGRLMLLAGEPGIGKTRTAEELAGYARSRNMYVAIGRCYEGEGAPPFWPWVQIVRAYLADHDQELLRAAMGVGAAVIAQVLPDVRDYLPDLSVPPILEPQPARFRFFDSFTMFLKNAAKMQPLVLILDDLHWADSLSLLLLQFLARELSNACLLVIGTYRDGELAPEHPLTHALGELARVPGSQSLSLRCLTASEVSRFIELTITHAPSPSLVSAVFQKTGGNPFFVTEVVHTLVREGRLGQGEGFSAEDLPLPQRVRVAVSHRLGTLSEPCRRALTAASAIGGDFDLTVLESLEMHSSSALAGERLLKTLNEAAAAHFVVPESCGIGRYRFAHALVREALYETLSADQRVRLHRQIGETVEQLSGRDTASSPATNAEQGPSIHSEQFLTTLAYHFFQAAPGGDVGKAMAYAIRAGERATATFAYEEAARHYERALQLLALQHSDETQRCELVLALGEAHRKAGKIAAAKDAFRLAANLARTLRSSEKDKGAATLLARAALGFATGFGGVTVTGGIEDTFVIDLLEEAVRAVGEEESPLQAQVLGRLAVELYWSHEPKRRATLSRQAVEVARRCGDTGALAYALNAQHVVLREPGNVEERLAIASDIMRLAGEIGDKELTLRGHMWRLTDLLELGDLQTADGEIVPFAQRAEELRQPSYLWFLATWRATRAWLKGRFTEAEQWAAEALAIGQRAQDPDAAQCFIVQIFALRSGVKGFHDIKMPVQDLAERYTALPAWRSSLALAYAGFGAKEEARHEFEQFAVHHFTNIPRNADWMITMTNLVQVCSILHDVPSAETLYQLLLPYAERCVVVKPALVCLGPVTRFLGLLATILTRWDEAEAHFVSALQRCAQMDARPLIAQTQQHYAGMLLARKRPSDREQALAVLDQALALAQDIGMDELANRILARKNKVLNLAS